MPDAIEAAFGLQPGLAYPVRLNAQTLSLVSLAPLGFLQSRMSSCAKKSSNLPKPQTLNPKLGVDRAMSRAGG